METPSSAVTAVVMILAPTFKGIAADAAPDITIVPFTVTVDVETTVVGITCMLLIALLTDAV